MSLTFVKVSLFLLFIRQCSLFSFEYALKKVDSFEARVVALETADRLKRLEIDEIYVQFSEFDKKLRAMNVSLISANISKDVKNCNNSVVSTDGHSASNLVKGMAAEKLMSYKKRTNLERFISYLQNVFSDRKNKFEQMTKMLKSEIDQNRENLINGQALLADTCDAIKEGYRNEMASLKAEFENSQKEMKNLERLISSLKNVFSDHENKFEEMTKMLKSEIDQNRENLKNGQALLADTCKTVKEGYRNEMDSLKAEFEHSQKEMKNETNFLKDVTKNQRAIKIKSCVDLLSQKQFAIVSGIYELHNGLKVYCDQTTDGGGWIVFQRREDGSVNFERTWNNYKAGFGDLLHEFWLGNDNLQVLTEHGNHELRIDMEDFEGNKAYAKYSHFKVYREVAKYRLIVSGYSGNAGDSLIKHNGKAFSTVDRDNEQYPGNCAKRYRGAWWYHSGCHHSNLNGFYYQGSGSPRGKGVIWYYWKKSQTYSLKFVEMKLRST
ncbi:angiopoietin-related protein 7-like [Ruditapes philippinarum]|uniref:angiopoietin-related protein 7-like n=1 Tax=Ruditapes philippinarum TaxID=129788 RepID=UPI00295B9755|nr:angiopoietin-related protein 7-like [Ruditapes philippinarum]